MLIPFDAVVSNALTPITLISGVGLVMLCMTNRYNHTVDRIRQLLKLYADSTNTEEPDLLEEIHLIYYRSSLLRRAILCIAISAIFSGLMIATNITAYYLQLELSVLALTWLGGALAMIILATGTFALEATVSLHALHLAVEHLPPLPELDKEKK